MKLLIIAGPYEADRLRKAAVSAGFETVAVEPGESLSGWISASRPDLIVMAPKIVNADPAVALAKVRTIPRGRVPIFLVGDAADEPRFKGLADGFFVRPVSPDDLIAEARSLLGTVPPPAGSGPGVPEGAAGGGGSDPVAAGEGIPQRSADQGSDGTREPASSGRTPKSGPHGLKTPPNLKPLVAQGEAPAGTPARAGRASALSGPMLLSLEESIEAAIEDDIREAIRRMGTRDRTGTPVGRPRHAPADVAAAPAGASSSSSSVAAGAGPAPAPDSQESSTALSELRDESSQKTLEVPRDVVARMASADSEGHNADTAAGRSSEGGGRAAGVPAPAETGNLAQQDIAMLLARIFVERLTGWLTLRREGVEKAVVFERGAPILAGSNLPADRMGDMLVRQGRLSPEQQTRSVEILRATGRRLGVVLVESGFIKAGELGPLVRRHFEEIIYSLFAWESGDWVLSPDRPEKEENVLLNGHPAALIVEGIRRKFSAARLRARVGGGQVILRVTKEAGLSSLLAEMTLTDDERRLVGLFDGVRALDDVAARAGADEATLLAVTWALLLLRRLGPVSDGASAAGGAGASTGDVGGAGEGAARDREIDRARILARYALVRDGDYFQVLGVSRQASAHEIRRAHQALLREFGRQALAPELAVDLAGPLEAIRTVIDEGARVLGDPRHRQRYQSHLLSSGSGSSSGPGSGPEQEPAR
ncbi:MAG: hypothetical protein QOI66_3074 [Myxococcales bacterium]|nr:hypothetical protein [Myxococcales bacterium]